MNYTNDITVKATETNIDNAQAAIKPALEEPKLFWFNELNCKNRNSDNVIICVSGYLSKNGNEDWSKLIQCYPDSAVYSVNWDSNSFSDILNYILSQVGEFAEGFEENGIFQKSWKQGSIFELLVGGIVKIFEFKHAIWDKSYREAQKIGRHLAEKLISEDKFKNKNISLVGFSLGTVVISTCMKELANSGNTGLLQDVVLMGGVASLKDFEEENMFAVAKRTVNVLSRNDNILTYLLKLVSLDTEPIGIQEIRSKSEKILNIDRTDMIKGHMHYRSEMDKIFCDIQFAQVSKEEKIELELD